MNIDKFIFGIITICFIILIILGAGALDGVTIFSLIIVGLCWIYTLITLFGNKNNHL